MKLTEFDYCLPSELIAKYPLKNRTDSRLLSLDGNTGDIAHQHFFNLPDLLEPNDLLVFNNTRVIPARVFGHKKTGGRVEILVERLISGNEMLAQLRFNKKLKIGVEIVISETHSLTLIDRQDDLFTLRLNGDGHLLDVLDQVGHMPLPPYLKREDELLDKTRYQTVYAKTPGAVAAPTAGLHFDERLLAQLKEKKIETTFITLHVGAGTFQPVRVDNIEEHHMHAEFIDVSQAVCDKIQQTHDRGGRVVAIGTTALRALEAASQSGKITPFVGDTDIFIYPGYQFLCVDALVTNFHLPKSSLLMLVSAFSGREHIRQAYDEAIKKQYRFFSYGDAMLLSRRTRCAA
jgi:S-adenosylmethionine:tRNA ribosyltransferase-isomerase